MRIDEGQATLHHAAMDEHVAERLFDQAVDLAHRAFGEDASDDHVEWAYQRLVMHWRWGLPAAGVVTVH